LAFAATHSSRSPRDTFYFDETHLLRTETSPSQIHILEEKEPPIYMVSIGRVYRRDAITATRYPIFHQFEGLAVDEGITLADLKGTLLHVMRALYGPERRVRFRTHFFPFTEPSIEPDVSCGICGGVGCRTCKYSGWLEMGGAGVVDPQVFENVGVDTERWSGFAFGCGLERAAQLRHDIPDIRLLWDGDLRVLRQF
ncbi:MAG TPA: phenylalanine--tRNA ligase subunit alpha, partial [Gaiellaceae bacterium]